MAFGDVVSRVCASGSSACCGPGVQPACACSAAPLPGRIFTAFSGGTGGLACFNGLTLMLAAAPGNSTGCPQYTGSFLLPGGVCTGNVPGGTFNNNPDGQTRFPLTFSTQCIQGSFPNGFPGQSWVVGVSCGCLPTGGQVTVPPTIQGGTPLLPATTPGPGLPVSVTLAFAAGTGNGAYCPQFCNGSPLVGGDVVQVTVTAADGTSADASQPGAVLSRECVLNPTGCCTGPPPGAAVTCCAGNPPVPSRWLATFFNCVNGFPGPPTIGDLTCLNGFTAEVPFFFYSPPPYNGSNPGVAVWQMPGRTYVPSCFAPGGQQLYIQSMVLTLFCANPGFGPAAPFVQFSTSSACFSQGAYCPTSPAIISSCLFDNGSVGNNLYRGTFSVALQPVI